MIEQVYAYHDFPEQTDRKLIEKIVDDSKLVISHMILAKNTGLPEHYSGSKVYIIVTRGTMTVELNNTASKNYGKGSIITIPSKIKMNIKNLLSEPLELFMIKGPN